MKKIYKAPCRLLLCLSVFCCLLLLTNCQKQGDSYTILNIKLPELAGQGLTMSEFSEGLLKHIPSVTTDTLSIENPVILSLQSPGDYQSYYVFVRPGETIEIGEGEEEATLRVSGGAGEENAVLREYADAVRFSGIEANMFDLSTLEPDSFLLAFSELCQPLENLVGRAVDKEAFSPDFKRALQQRYQAFRGTALMNYELYYEYQRATKPDLPDTFYDELSKIALEPSLLVFEEGKAYGNLLNEKALAGVEFESLGDHFTALYHQVDSTFQDPMLKSYFQLGVLENQISFGSSIDDMQPLIEAYRGQALPPYLEKRLAQTLAPWDGLYRGDPAPDFTGMTREGDPVKLSQLKGKTIYVDVWATWCQPCIAEIPSLKSLEAELHDQPVEFVSISIDEQRNQDRWLAFIERENLGGTQLLAAGAWQSDIVQSYNIQGIPRFLLIDPEGKILSSNAPRPSDPATKALLESSVTTL